MNDLYYITMCERKIVCLCFNNVWFQSEQYYILSISEINNVSMCSMELVTELHNELSESLTFIETTMWLVKHLCIFAILEYTFRTLNMPETINNEFYVAFTVHFHSLFSLPTNAQT
jgi:hypothetical protein